MQAPKKKKERNNEKRHSPPETLFLPMHLSFGDITTGEEKRRRQEDLNLAAGSAGKINILKKILRDNNEKYTEGN
jgi:hypothetical protein